MLTSGVTYPLPLVCPGLGSIFKIMTILGVCVHCLICLECKAYILSIMKHAIQHEPACV